MCLFRVPMLQFQTAPTISQSPKTVASYVPIERLRGVISAEPSEATWGTQYLVRVIPHEDRHRYPVTASTKVDRRLTPIVSVRITMFTVHRQPITFNNSLVSIKAQVVSVHSQNHTTLIIRPTVNLIIGDRQANEVNFFRVSLCLYGFLVPMQFIHRQPRSSKEVIPMRLSRLRVHLRCVQVMFEVTMIRRLPILVHVVTSPASQYFRFRRRTRFIASFRRLFAEEMVKDASGVTIHVPMRLSVLPFRNEVRRASNRQVRFVSTGPSRLSDLTVCRWAVPLCPSLTRTGAFLCLLSGLIQNSSFSFRHVWE